MIERSGDLNANANGQRVVVTTAMLRFVPDDRELGLVLAHEIAHNAMRHLDAQKRNVVLGALFGAVVDAAAAANGYDTQGTFTKAGAEAGAMSFSQDFEREADYVGLYILALAGQPIDSVANFWRRMAVENPTSIRFASSHPTSPERFVRLERWRQEVQVKLAEGRPLIPESRGGRIRINPQFATTPRARAPASGGALALSPGRASEPTPTRLDGSSAGGISATTPAPSAVEASAAARSALTVAPPPPAGALRPADPRFARAVIGAPSSESDRAAAVLAFDEGMRHAARRDWKRAAATFDRTLQLDGSVAAYHAARGDAMFALGELADAEASFAAATLIEPGDELYRARLAEVRRRRER